MYVQLYVKRRILLYLKNIYFFLLLCVHAIIISLTQHLNIRTPTLAWIKYNICLCWWVIWNPKPSPTATCQEGPNRRSMASLINLQAAYNQQETEWNKKEKEHTHKTTKLVKQNNKQVVYMSRHLIKIAFVCCKRQIIKGLLNNKRILLKFKKKITLPPSFELEYIYQQQERPCLQLP